MAGRRIAKTAAQHIAARAEKATFDACIEPGEIAFSRPLMFWRDGWAQSLAPARWDGRGLALELGVRAYGARMAELPGRWPPTLIQHERMLIDFEENADG